jgi:FkbM family methyltransferase
VSSPLDLTKRRSWAWALGANYREMALFGTANLRRLLREHVARRLRLPEIPVALQRLARQGFEPELIFDVGAYRGDFARQCKKVWPSTRIACFEPQSSILSELHQCALEHSQIDVYEILLGAEDNHRVVLNEAETASSIFLEKAGPRHPKATYEMRTMKSIIESETHQAPDLLKLDVQGYELEVLKGASTCLDEINVLLIELNLIDIHEDVPLMDEVVGWLAERGWVAFDICGLTRRPLDDALWQADFVFVPLNSSFRKDKRWQ